MLRVAPRLASVLHSGALAPRAASGLRAQFAYQAPVRALQFSAPRWEAPQMAVEPRLQLSFTCTVPNCGTRSTHEFSKHSYEHGIVLVQCPGCKNRYVEIHLC